MLDFLAEMAHQIKHFCCFDCSHVMVACTIIVAPCTVSLTLIQTKRYQHKIASQGKISYTFGKKKNIKSSLYGSESKQIQI